jgi:HSP20 family molecular chaperone IbpA
MEVEDVFVPTLEQIFSGIESSLFDFDSKSLKPLHRIEETEGILTITFDLPRVNKDTVSITLTTDSIRIEARMKEPISLLLGGPYQKRIEFHSYSAKVKLPAKVDESRKRVSHLKNGLLVISLPIIE